MSKSILAQKYATALTRSLSKDELERTISEVISYIDKILQNTPLSKVLLNPVSPNTHKEKEIKQITQNSKSENKMSEKFFLLLLKKKRLPLIPDIKNSLKNELNEIQNKIEVDIYISKETNSTEIDKILNTVKKLTPKNIKANLQEDKKITFNSFDSVLLSLQVMTEITKKIKFNKKNMFNAVNNSYATATDLADWLVKELDLPFREAHGITGKIVNFASKKKISISELLLEELQQFEKRISKSVYDILSPLNSMKSKRNIGGTSPQSVKTSIKNAIKKYL